MRCRQPTKRTLPELVRFKATSHLSVFYTGWLRDKQVDWHKSHRIQQRSTHLSVFIMGLKRETHPPHNLLSLASLQNSPSPQRVLHGLEAGNVDVHLAVQLLNGLVLSQAHLQDVARTARGMAV